MQERHANRLQYFKEQAYTTETHVIPFIEQHLPIKESLQVLEIGCGEGGNMLPFLDRGCQVTGIDLANNKIENAAKFYQDHPNKQNLTLISQDIYAIEEDIKFDLIIMRDVLEHIHNQEKFMHYVKRFMKPKALFFLGFPPWQNPFGGHQQICKSKFLSKLPYFHILPMGLYKAILTAFKEPQLQIDSLVEIKETSITIERFKKIIKKERYLVLKKQFYFINPNYEIKFNLKPKKQWFFINKTPFIRNFLITTCYYLLTTDCLWTDLSKPDENLKSEAISTVQHRT